MRKYLLSLLLILPSLFSTATAADESPQSPVIVAYVTSWSTIMPDPWVMTHLNYAFGHVNDTFDGVRIDNADRMRDIVKLKDINPRLKVMLSIGGWTSGGFSEMASTAKRRRAFAEDCARVVREYNLDGIDIDWEYPGSNAAGISASPSDPGNFVKLVAELRRSLGHDYLLTIASEATATGLHLGPLSDYIDFINIMAYDMERVPRHHSPLHHSPAITGDRTVEHAVETHLAAGVPPSKLVLGVPFYGRGKDPYTDFVDFGKITLRPGCHREWDSVACAPFITDSTGTLVLGYEDTRSLKLKCDYLAAKGLRGAMYWECAGDDASLTLSRLLAEQISGMTVKISNPSDLAFSPFIAEIDGTAITGRHGSNFMVTDSRHRPVTHQLTHDGKLLIETWLQPHSDAIYTIIPSPASTGTDTLCVGQLRPDIQDDYAWENDLTGFRLYGPRYRAEGGDVSGYDIWTKSVTIPVLADRYTKQSQQGISYHHDHGNGMDAYAVGPTFGAGMCAPVCADGSYQLPIAYEKCEILDNGPLRTSAHITCYPTVIDGDTIVEHRTITLDRGSWLNTTTITYSGLDHPIDIATGIVIHRQAPEAYITDTASGIMAYADPTDNPSAGNGVIYVGTITPDATVTRYEPLSSPSGDATGHLIALTPCTPGQSLTYHWGAAWSKHGMPDFSSWQRYLNDYRRSLVNRPTVSGPVSQ